MENKLVIHCWFSCGVASAVAAKTVLDMRATGEIPRDSVVRIIYNPVIEEHEDNLRFLSDCEKWLGQKIERAINPKYPLCSARDVWRRRKYMAGIGAPCTLELKKMARKEFERIHGQGTIVLGFSADEQSRAERFKKEYENSFFPLVEKGITKEKCFEIISQAGIKRPEIYNLGFPNANCIGCVKASSATYWNLVREKFPQVFADRAEQSRRLGARLVRWRGRRMFLDELPPTARGRSLKNFNIDCGIFCTMDEK